LLAAEAEVTVMMAELITLQPILVATGQKVQQTLALVNIESLEAAKVRAVVATDEVAAGDKAKAASTIKEDCESELCVAVALLESSLRALDTLTKADITEVKAMKNPPGAVKIVMETVCHMLDVKPKRINDPNKPGAKVEDYWTPSLVISAT
jgi:dynein heavy chain, axonemal